MAKKVMPKSHMAPWLKRLFTAVELKLYKIITTRHLADGKCSIRSYLRNIASALWGLFGGACGTEGEYSLTGSIALYIFFTF